MVDFDPAVVGRDVTILVSQQVFTVFVAPPRRARTPPPKGVPQIVDPGEFGGSILVCQKLTDSSNFLDTSTSRKITIDRTSETGRG